MKFPACLFRVSFVFKVVLDYSFGRRHSSGLFFPGIRIAELGIARIQLGRKTVA